MGNLLIPVILGKVILFLTKKLNRGTGTAAPGYYALKITPDFIDQVNAFLPQSVIITGTNGKTTTTQILSQIAANSNIKFIRNNAGSNLERGIVSTLLEQLSVSDFLQPQKIKQNFNLCIWELDEAAFVTVAPKIKPKAVLFLNIFRDQLDRYGEIDTTLKKWGRAIKKLDPGTKIFINSDDATLHELKNDWAGPIINFAINGEKIKGERALLDNNHTPQIWAKNIKLQGIEGSVMELMVNQQKINLKFPLPGLYNVYNLLAAVALADFLNIDLSHLQAKLEGFSPAFGRVEKIYWSGHTGYIFLMKNPVGASEVFKLLAKNLKPTDGLMLALNDNLADGTDVSWIWDARFEKLIPTKRRNPLIISGTRAYELALRLKYAGMDQNALHVEPDLESAFNALLQTNSKKIFMIPTYTALLSLQKILIKKKIKTN